MVSTRGLVEGRFRLFDLRVVRCSKTSLFSDNNSWLSRSSQGIIAVHSVAMLLRIDDVGAGVAAKIDTKSCCIVVL